MEQPWRAALTGGGILFKLSPPSTAGGVWTESVAYTFAAGAGGLQPSGDLILSQNGNLDGTTNWGAWTPNTGPTGTVFQLAPPTSQASVWSESDLYAPPGVVCDLNWPNAGAIVESSGSLIGTAPCGSYRTGNAGTLFKLTPPTVPGGPWGESDLHLFMAGVSDGFVPSGNLATIDGVLYGTTQGGGGFGMGTVYQYSPSGSYKVLHSFSGGVDGAFPIGGLVAANRILYGTTSEIGNGGNGNVFMLVAGVGGLWSASNLYTFQGGASDGATPVAAMTVAPSTATNGAVVFFGTTMSGGQNNNGTVFQLNIPPPANPPGYSAICNLNCFENSLKWRLPPPRWVLDANGIGLVGAVQQITNGGRTVEFLVKEMSTPANTVAPVERRLTLTLERKEAFKPGQRWIFFAKKPLSVLSSKLELLGFWPDESRGASARSIRK